jgi:hypothetical protein
MTIILGFLAGLLLLSLVGALAVFLTRNPLKPALATLLAILSGIATSFVSADARATAGGRIQLPWFALDFDVAYLNPTRPAWLWILMFFGTGAMVLYVATLLHKDPASGRQAPGA